MEFDVFGKKKSKKKLSKVVVSGITLTNNEAKKYYKCNKICRR